MRLAVHRGLLGLALSLGAPLGWLAMRTGNATGPLPGWIAEEIAAHAGLYGYMLLGTALAFVAFGVVLGRYEERLADDVDRFSVLAATDPLTGLANRRSFVDALAAALARSDRIGQPVAVILMDLDHFKRVNDLFGHPTGDRVLRAVAQALAVDARVGDVVARYGGEEFALVLEATGARGGLARAERLRERIAGLEVPLDGGGTVAVAASFGVAVHPDHGGTDLHGLLALADAALYTAKRTGRDRTVLAPAPRMLGGGGA